MEQQAIPNPADKQTAGTSFNTEVSDSELFAAGDHTKEGNNNAQNNNAASSGNTETSRPTEAPKSPKQNLGSLISGKAAVDFANMIIPSGVTFTMRKMGYEMDKKDLQFSASEKEILSPYFQEWLNTLNIDLNNPLYNLLIGLGIVYSSKFMDKESTIRPIRKPSKVVPITRQTVSDIGKQNGSFVNVKEDLQPDPPPENLYEQIVGDKKIEESKLNPQQKKYRKLVGDTVKKRKCSRLKAIEWLKKQGFLPIEYSE